MSGIFGGTQKSTSSTSNGIPSWVQQGSKDVWGRAQTVNSRPYEGYTGQRVADLTPNETDAYSTVRAALGSPTNFGQANSMTQQGVAGLGGMASDYASKAGDPYASVQSYMDPYLGGVLDPVLRNIREQSAMTANGNAANATGAGAFGDARHGVVDAMNNRDTERNVGDATNQIYSTAFGNAQQQRQNAINTFLGLQTAGNQAQIAGGSQLAQLQGAQTADTLAKANAAAGAGQAEREVQQNKDNTSYSDFLEKRGWDQQQINSLLSALNGMPYTKTSDTTTKTPTAGGAGLIGSILGAL
jgi:hypothetical protein